MSKGPLDELLKAIEDLIGDIQEKQEQSESDFDERTSLHTSEVQRLTDEINTAQVNIANTETFL